MNPENNTPQANTPESTHLNVIEVPEEIKIKVNRGIGEAAMENLMRKPIPVEPQPGREPIVVPMPADPSHIVGWHGEVRR